MNSFIHKLSIIIIQMLEEVMMRDFIMVRKQNLEM